MSGIKLIAENRQSRFNYHLLEKYEAGMVLLGSEVKSLRGGHCQLKDSYVAFRGEEAWLQKAHIAPYYPAGLLGHIPERDRKLLLNKNELKRLMGAVQEKGYSIIPTKIYLKKNRIKLEIALGKGKSKGDKRETLKRRDSDREIAQSMRKSRGSRDS